MAKPAGYLLNEFTWIAHFRSQISSFGRGVLPPFWVKKTTNSPVLQNNDKNNMTIAPTTA